MRNHFGIVLYAPRFYDFLAWAVMFGREGAFREKVIDLAHPKPGESVSGRWLRN